MDELFIGLMSGTSLDAIDVAVVEFTPQPRVVEAHSYPLPDALRLELLAFAHAEYRGDPIEQLGRLDHEFAAACANATNSMLDTLGEHRTRVRAIGSHGQTVRHRPPIFTLQLGDPNLIAARTGLTVVADLRRMDLAFGGQGAPLLPAFHRVAFGSGSAPRAVVNIGGIANVTLLEPAADTRGHDVGPGNALLDAWYAKHHGGAYDAGGAWAASAAVDADLLAALGAEPWFGLLAPKSTGRELFNLAWAERLSGGLARWPVAVVQSTFCELTVAGIVQVLMASRSADVVVCGGGVHNRELMRRLDAAAAPLPVRSSAELGIDPDFVEAAGFAWLARESLAGRVGNLPSVTGAARAAHLGGIYRP